MPPVRGQVVVCDCHGKTFETIEIARYHEMVKEHKRRKKLAEDLEIYGLPTLAKQILKRIK
jgi:hypothetical protein